jgi:NAD(P)-dependent dehydrogenase (short-subunit alcohol dehydrogenase family)
VAGEHYATAHPEVSSAGERDRYPSNGIKRVGKIAFITGGASGIGAALATKLVEKDAEVWIADRQVGPAEELAQGLNRRWRKGARDRGRFALLPVVRAGCRRGGAAIRADRLSVQQCRHWNER